MMRKRTTCIGLPLLLFLLLGIYLIARRCGDANTPSEADRTGFDVIAERIEAKCAALGYSRDTCRDVVEMVRPWPLSEWNERLVQADKQWQRKEISATQCGAIEQEVANGLYGRIRQAIRCDSSPQHFDLAYIVRDKKAQCLGLSQLFDILGNSIGLSVNVIRVLELDTGMEVQHVACMIHLSNGTAIMADLMDGGFISQPFRLHDQFTANSGILKLKEKDNPLHLYRRIKVWYGDELASAVYSHRGSLNLGHGKILRGLRDVNTAIELDPENAMAFCFRAIANRMLGELPAAISDASRAIEINPMEAVAYQVRGSAYLSCGDARRSLSDFSRAIEIDPTSALAHARRGRVHANLGHMEQARKDLQRAMHLDPSIKVLVGEVSKEFDIDVDLKDSKTERQGDGP